MERFSVRRLEQLFVRRFTSGREELLRGWSGGIIHASCSGELALFSFLARRKSADPPRYFAHLELRRGLFCHRHASSRDHRLRPPFCLPPSLVHLSVADLSLPLGQVSSYLRNLPYAGILEFLPFRVPCCCCRSESHTPLPFKSLLILPLLPSTFPQCLLTRSSLVLIK